MDVNVGCRIKKYRKKKKLSQKELAKLIGCDKQTISLYERGKFNPTASIIVALADILEVTTDELLKENFLCNRKSFQRDDELITFLTRLDELPPEDRTTVKNLLKLLLKK